jgi:NADH-quinone oxidoreductase subunit B
MALRAKLLYDQMPDPKYVISMGACATCGGLFQLAYSVCKGVDKIMPGRHLRARLPAPPGGA